MGRQQLDFNIEEFNKLIEKMVNINIKRYRIRGVTNIKEVEKDLRETLKDKGIQVQLKKLSDVEVKIEDALTKVLANFLKKSSNVADLDSYIEKFLDKREREELDKHFKKKRQLDEKSRKVGYRHWVLENRLLRGIFQGGGASELSIMLNTMWLALAMYLTILETLIRWGIISANQARITYLKHRDDVIRKAIESSAEYFKLSTRKAEFRVNYLPVLNFYGVDDFNYTEEYLEEFKEIVNREREVKEIFNKVDDFINFKSAFLADLRRIKEKKENGEMETVDFVNSIKTIFARTYGGGAFSSLYYIKGYLNSLLLDIEQRENLPEKTKNVFLKKIKEAMNVYTINDGITNLIKIFSLLEVIEGDRKDRKDYWNDFINYVDNNTIDIKNNQILEKYRNFLSLIINKEGLDNHLFSPKMADLQNYNNLFIRTKDADLFFLKNQLKEGIPKNFISYSFLKDDRYLDFLFKLIFKDDYNYYNLSFLIDDIKNSNDLIEEVEGINKTGNVIDNLVRLLKEYNNLLLANKNVKEFENMNNYKILSYNIDVILSEMEKLGEEFKSEDLNLLKKYLNEISYAKFSGEERKNVINTIHNLISFLGESKVVVDFLEFKNLKIKDEVLKRVKEEKELKQTELLDYMENYLFDNYKLNFLNIEQLFRTNYKVNEILQVDIDIDKLNDLKKNILFLNEEIFKLNKEGVLAFSPSYYNINIYISNIMNLLKELKADTDEDLKMKLEKVEQRIENVREKVERYFHEKVYTFEKSDFLLLNSIETLVTALIDGTSYKINPDVLKEFRERKDKDSSENKENVEKVEVTVATHKDKRINDIMKEIEEYEEGRKQIEVNEMDMMF